MRKVVKRAWGSVALMAVLLVAMILLLSGFQSATGLVSPEAFTVIAVGAIGLFILRAVSVVTQKATTAFEQFSELMGVLYGPKDGNGVRTNDGYLAKIDRISVTCERIPEIEGQIADVAVQAATAAEAVQHLQRTVHALLPPHGGAS